MQEMLIKIKEMIWNKDSFGETMSIMKDHWSYHTHMLLSHLIFITHGHVFKIMLDSFFSKCCLLPTISLVWKLPKPWKQKPFSIVCEERALP